MVNPDKIRGEEKGELLLTRRTISLLSEADKDIKLAVQFIIRVEGLLYEIIKEDNVAHSEADLVLRRLKRGEEYHKFRKENQELTGKAIELTGYAIRKMNDCTKPLTKIEQLAKKIEREWGNGKFPALQRQITFEEGIFNSARNVSLRIASNIRQCEEIKKQLASFLARTTGGSEYPTPESSYLERLRETLWQTRNLFMPVEESIGQQIAVLNRIAQVEAATLKQ